MVTQTREEAAAAWRLTATIDIRPERIQVRGYPIGPALRRFEESAK